MQRHQVSGATTAVLLMGAQSAAIAAMLALSSFLVDDRGEVRSPETRAPAERSWETCLDPLDPTVLLPF